MGSTLAATALGRSPHNSYLPIDIALIIPRCIAANAQYISQMPIAH
ncbi:MAG: hypothetical protein ABI262_21115 [Microcoleus sp.]